MSRFKQKKILIALSGSIACYKAPQLISRLVKEGAQVKTITTDGALQFIGEATLEGLTGEKNQTDIFSNGQMMNHIHLSRWADMMIVYPASANLIASLAHGFAQDLVSCVFLARPKHLPVFVAPAMNQEMWSSSILKKNVETLKKNGVLLLGPDTGPQACGEIGAGRLIEPELAFEQLEQALQRQDRSWGSVLITYGGTSEKIDSVRSIENTSTGQTGRLLAEELHKEGWNVTVLKARKAEAAHGAIEVRDFTSFQEFEEQLKSLLTLHSFDWVIQAAAVSDFSVANIKNETGIKLQGNRKISSASRLTIELQPNPKLISQIKSWSQNKKTQVVGFKLTSNANAQEAQQKVQEVLNGGGVDFVVHNDLSGIRTESHVFQIFSPVDVVANGQSKKELCRQLHRLMQTQASNTQLAQSEVEL